MSSLASFTPDETAAIEYAALHPSYGVSWSDVPAFEVDGLPYDFDRTGLELAEGVNPSCC